MQGDKDLPEIFSVCGDNGAVFTWVHFHMFVKLPAFANLLPWRQKKYNVRSVMSNN